MRIDIYHHIVGSLNMETAHKLLEKLNRIEAKEDMIMSAVSDFVAKQKTYNDKTGAAIDSIVASQTGLAADIAALNDKITALQNSQGTVTPEDQALIDGIEADGVALSDKADAVAAALAALDAQTPPTPPTT